MRKRELGLVSACMVLTSVYVPFVMQEEAMEFSTARELRGLIATVVRSYFAVPLRHHYGTNSRWIFRLLLQFEASADAARFQAY